LFLDIVGIEANDVVPFFDLLFSLEEEMGWDGIGSDTYDTTRNDRYVTIQNGTIYVTRRYDALREDRRRYDIRKEKRRYKTVR
jgi:hypothetical protein